MTSAYRLLALVVLPAFVAFLPGCHKASTVSSEPLYIMLTYNAGNCEQNGGTGIVDVYSNQSVIYEGATAQAQFRVDFANCPLAAGNCPVNSPNGRAANVGAPLASAAGSTFLYRSMTIDNQTCNGAQSMGVRVHPAR